jgi:hypothetical protein
MKLLEPGRIDKAWTIQHRCTGWGNDDSGCNALLEIELDDLRYYVGEEYPWRTVEPAVCFKCPCCGKVTDLGLDNWPKNYRNLKRCTSDWRDADTAT